MNLRQAAEQALKYFEDAHGLEDAEVEIKEALRQALAQPVDAVNMSQKCVDETAKREHEPVAWVIEDGEVDYYVDVVAKIKPGTPLYTAPQPVREVWCDCGDGIMPNSGAKCGNCIAADSAAREWVGLDGEIPGLGLVTEEFYNGMIFAEDILREKNGG